MVISGTLTTQMVISARHTQQPSPQTAPGGRFIKRLNQPAVESIPRPFSHHQRQSRPCQVGRGWTALFPGTRGPNTPSTKLRGLAVQAAGGDFASLRVEVGEADCKPHLPLFTGTTDGRSDQLVAPVTRGGWSAGNVRDSVRG